MKKKKTFMLIMLITFLFSISASSQKLLLKMKDGTYTSSFLNEIRKLTFSSGNLVLMKTGGNTNLFPLTNLRFISFSDVTSVPQTSLNEVRVILYPVPVSDILTVSISGVQIQPFIVEIINIEGKIIYQSLYDLIPNLLQINITFLPKGLYLCRVYNWAFCEVKKFNKL